MSNRNKSRINVSKLILFLFLIATTIPTTTEFFSPIFKSKNNFIESLSPNKIQQFNEYRVCFSGFDIRTRYLIVKDVLVTNIQNIFDVNSFFIIEKNDPNNSINITSNPKHALVSISGTEESLFFQSSIFSQMKVNDKNYESNTNNTYCLYFLATSDISSLNNLQIIPSTDISANRIDLGIITLTNAFKIYDLDNSSNNSNTALIINNYSLSTQEIYKNTPFDITLTYLVTLPNALFLPTTEEDIIIILETYNLNVSSSILSFSNAEAVSSVITSEYLKAPTRSPFVEILSESKIKISKFGENLIDKRSFKIKISNCKLIDDNLSSNSNSIITRVLWKNTNSVISSHSIAISITPKRYGFSEVTLKQRNNLNLFFTGSFAMTLTFKLERPNNKESIILTDTTNTVLFLPATCDFSANIALKQDYLFDNNPKKEDIVYCEYSKVNNGNDSNYTYNYNSLEIKNASISKNILFTLNFWFSFPKTAQTTLTKPVFTIVVNNISYPFSIPFNYQVSYDYDFNNTNFSQSNCVDSTSNNSCTKNLLSKNYSGAFVLLSYNGIPPTTDFINSTFGENVDTPKSLFNLKDEVTSSEDNERFFRLRFRANTNTIDIYNVFAGDWISKDAFNNSNYYSIGTHSLIFPHEFFDVISLNNITPDCKTYWGSSVSRLANSGSATIFNYNTLIDSAKTTTSPFLNNFFTHNSSNTIFTTGNTNKNIIEFTNHNIANNNLTVGFLHNLLHTVDCTTNPSTCSKIASKQDSDVTTTHIDTEIVSSCAKLKSDFNIKSIYTPFEFTHAFTLKGSSLITRVTRFVSLFPQPGIFNTANIAVSLADNATYFTTSQDNILTFDYGFSTISSFDAICLISLNLNSSTLILTRNSNTKLNLFLSGINALDYYDVFNYPISSGKSRLYAGMEQSLKITNEVTAITKYQKNYSNDTDKTLYYTNTDYSEYLSTRIEILVSSSITTNNNYIIIPVLCGKTNNNNFLRSISVTDIDRSVIDVNQGVSNSVFSPLFYYADTTKTPVEIKFEFENDIDHTSSDVYTTTTKFTSFISGSTLTENDGFIINSTYTEDLEETNRNYFFLLSNSEISSGIIIKDQSGTIVAASQYSVLSISNTIRLNNVLFPYSAVIYIKVSDASIDTFGILNSSNKSFNLNVGKINVPQRNDGPIADDDFGFMLLGDSTSTARILNSNGKYYENYYVANYNNSNKIDNIAATDKKSKRKLSASKKIVLTNFSTSKKYLVLPPGVISNPDSENIKAVNIIKDLNVITSSIKTGNGNRTVVGSFTVVLIENTNTINVVSPNITDNTIAYVKNLFAKVSVSNNSVTITINNNTSSNTNTSNNTVNNQFSVILLNLTVTDSFKITKITTYFKDSVTPYYEFDITDTPSLVKTVTTSTNNYNSTKVSSYKFDDEKLTYSNLTLFLDFDVEVFLRMRVVITSTAFSQLKIDSIITHCQVLIENEIILSNNDDYNTNNNKFSASSIIFNTCRVSPENNSLSFTTISNINTINFNSNSNTNNTSNFSFLPEKLARSIKILIFPVNVVDLKENTFSVKVTFDTDNSDSIFPEEATKPINKGSALLRSIKNASGEDVDAVMDISPLIIVTYIEPSLSSLPGSIRFEINFAEKIDSLNEFLVNSKITATMLNEISVFLPVEFYGMVWDDLQCGFGYIAVDNTSTINQNNDSDAITDLTTEKTLVSPTSSLDIVYNCEYYNQRILIRLDNGIKIDNNSLSFEIIGSNVVSNSVLNSLKQNSLNTDNSVFLIKINYITAFSSTNLMKGKASLMNSSPLKNKLIELIDPDSNNYINRENIKYANLRLSEFQLSSIIPFTSTSISFDLNVDKLSGINSVLFNNLELQGSVIYLTLPDKSLIFTSQSSSSILNSSITVLISVNELVLESQLNEENNISNNRLRFLQENNTSNSNSSIDSSNIIKIPQKVRRTTVLENKIIKLLGNLLVLQITSQKILNSSLFDNINFQINGILVPFTVGRITLPRLLIKKLNSKNSNFFFRTYENLSSNIGFSDNNNIINNISKTDDLFGFISYSRGYYVDYDSKKYSITVDYSKILKPGVLFPFTFNARIANKYFVSNTNKIEFKISNTSSKFTSIEEVIELDGFMKRNTTANIGLLCNSLPGKYLLAFTILKNDNNAFYTVAPLEIIVSTNANREKINFYTNSRELYSQFNPIILAKGGYTYFWVKPNYINIEKMNLIFSPDATNASKISLNYNSNGSSSTTVTSESSISGRILQSNTNANTSINSNTNNGIININKIDIPKFSQDYIIGKFGVSPKYEVSAKLRFTISVDGSDCYRSAFDFIEFFPSVDLTIINKDFDLSSVFTYVNADNNSSNISSGNSSNEKLSYNSIKFTLNKNKNVFLPANYELYCAVYCSLLAPPSIQLITTMPQPKNTWYLNYARVRVENSGVFNFIVDNTIRDMAYSMKCILESSHNETKDRVAIISTIDKIEGNTIQASATKPLSCVNIDVMEFNKDFETEAHKILQDSFLEKFVELGCVLVLNTNGKVMVDVLSEENLTCLKIKSILDAENESNQSSKSSMMESSVTSTTEDLTNSISSSTTDAATSIVSSTLDSPDSASIDINAQDKVIKNLINTYTFCLVQSKTCSKDPDTSSINTILTKLFSTNQTPSNNNNTNNTRQLISASSDFSSRLTPQSRNIYLGYNIIAPSDNYNFKILGLIVIDNSNHSNIKNDFKWKLDLEIKTEKPSETLCYWIISTKTAASDSMKSDEFLNCKTNASSSIIFCGEESFIPPSKIIAEIDVSNVSSSDEGTKLSMWMTCKQNMVVTSKFSEPEILITFYPVIPPKIDSSESNGVEVNTCVFESPMFPECCPTKTISESDPKICDSAFFSTLKTYLLYVLGFIVLLLN